MVETLYGVLGVGPDADEQTIVDAYRAAVKANHPDVSDRPDATARFKRLTTAREVLVDDAERARYDRVGHRTYVRRHLDPGVWDVPETGATGGGSATASSRPGSAAARAARPYADGGDATASADSVDRQSSTPTGGGTAASYYRPGERMRPADGRPAVDHVVGRVQRIGAWALVDLALVFSGFATAWLVLAWGSLSATSLLLAGGLLVAVLVATSLHVTARAAV